jgi:UDP-N-acetylmuramoylalanine--D-glutamate ligase
LGVAVDVGRHDLARIRGATAVVVSPGVPPSAPVVAAAREAGVEIVAELDLGARALDRSRLIAVTGTNGKTTTTLLIAHLLEAAGRRAVAAGNVGYALTEVALQETPPAWVAVEASSFQLHDAPGLAPAIGVVTNLAPDHLDRYPDVGEYYADKRLLFRNAGADSVWVLNAADPAVEDLAAGVVGRRRRFRLDREADAWFDRVAGRLVLDGAPLLPRAELRLLGDHNVENALAAALAAHAAGADRTALTRGLASFRAPPHRLEPVRVVGGVTWINDSKATNVAATLVALRAMTGPFVTILGGRHKGQPYTALGSALARCRAVVAYGEAADLVRRDLAGATAVEVIPPFDDAVRRAGAMARPGDTVLLSPACASFDQFENYEARGERFRAVVNGL